MDYVLRGQVIPSGDLGLAGVTTAECHALGQQTRPCRSVDRTIDTSAPQKGIVGGIDDSVNLQRGDVSLEYLHSFGHESTLRLW
jgi:hypothetical protein